VLEFLPKASHFLLCSREVKRDNQRVRENNTVVMKDERESLGTKGNAERKKTDFR